jgi:PEGA domain
MKTFFQGRPVDAKTALRIETKPKLELGKGGAVELDAVKVAEQSPHDVKPIAPGPHKVRVTLTGYISQELEIEVKEGEVALASLALERIPVADATAASQPVTATPRGNLKSRDNLDDHRTEPSPEEPNAKTPRTLLLSSTPPVPAMMGKKKLGFASGLRMQVDTVSELRLGGKKGYTFTISNKRSGLHFKFKNTGTRRLVVDGKAISIGDTFDVDTRPRRLEMTSDDATDVVVLLKVVD